eukprot:135264_1
MEELIRFQALVRSLTDTECIQFCAQFLNYIGRNLFITVLFNHLKYEIETDDNKSHLPNEINQILTNIINERKFANKTYDQAIFNTANNKIHIIDLSE